MPLVTSNEILERAMKEKYGVAAFNANCLEMIPALINAAEGEGSPLIIQLGKRFLDYLPANIMASVAIEAAKKAKVPVCVHLDHGSGMAMALDCLNAGFTSLMFDGSYLPIEENISISKRIAEIASKKGIPLEGEIGKVLISEGGYDFKDVEDDLTEPADAKRFVEESGVSSVAIAVGNLHRMRTKEAKLDFDRIKAIKKIVDVPLVMHGSSGISDNDIQMAVKCGITKVNIATEFNVAFLKGVSEKLHINPSEMFPMEVLIDGMKEVMQIAVDRIRMLGCNNKY
jgi:ketose-bisphosphate aldolase